MKKIILSFILSMSFPIISYAQNITHKNNEIYYFKLDNGLKLVIKKDDKALTAVHMVWYKVGSFDELPNKTGLSHILEHMMFKGTINYPNFSTVMANLGARENAFTNKDYTVYHQQLPSENLKQAIEMEADRMQNLNFNAINFQEKFNKELKVIQEERRLRTDDQAQNKIIEQLMAISYLVNSSRIPTIGWMEDIKKTNIQDAYAWYTKYYTPNNATVVIVGNINPQQVYIWVKNAYAQYKNSFMSQEDRYTRQEPIQNGIRSIEMYSNQITQPSVYTLYKTVSYTQNPKHALALALLSTLLAGYEYSYLDKIFVKTKKSASTIGAEYNILQRSLSNFIIYAKANPNININSLHTEIYNKVINLSDSLEQEDIKRAKKQWQAYNIYKKDLLLNTAMELGVTYSNDFDFKTLESIEQGIQTITIEDIKQVIKIYFKFNQQNNAFLLPEKLIN